MSDAWASVPLKRGKKRCIRSFAEDFEIISTSHLLTTMPWKSFTSRLRLGWHYQDNRWLPCDMIGRLHVVLTAGRQSGRSCLEMNKGLARTPNTTALLSVPGKVLTNRLFMVISSQCLMGEQYEEGGSQLPDLHYRKFQCLISIQTNTSSKDDCGLYFFCDIGDLCSLVTITTICKVWFQSLTTTAWANIHVLCICHLLLLISVFSYSVYNYTGY